VGGGSPKFNWQNRGISLSNDAGFAGFQQPDASTSQFNAQGFQVWSILSRVSTCTLGTVVSVTNDGGVSPVGFVDIQLLVNQIDGQGNTEPRGIIYKCPYQRLQGGANAVILDPKEGDIGIVVFADRDISSVTANKGQANPGSRRRFDIADALYIGGVLNGTPTQYIRFSDDGIVFHSPTDIKLEAPTIELNAGTSVTVNSPVFRVNGATQLNGPVSQVPGTQGSGASVFDGPLTVTNDVTAGGKSLESHTHGNVQNGPGTTGAPI